MRFLVCILFFPLFAAAQVGTYEEGESAYTKKDYRIAYQILKPLAEQGDSRAQTQLGILQLNQQSGFFDSLAGLEWLEKASAQKEIRALRNLGIFYTVGSKDGKIEKDLVKALKWSLLAAEAGDAHGQRNVAQTYAFGYGVPKDLEKAVYWYQKAAEQGDRSAQHNLGIAYYNGKGVKPDGNAAEEWFEKAAFQGDKDSALQLFFLLRDGKLLPLDTARAFCWFEVAQKGRAPNGCAKFSQATPLK